MKLEYNISLAALTDSYLMNIKENPSLKKRKKLAQWLCVIFYSSLLIYVIPYFNLYQTIITGSILMSIILFFNLFLVDKLLQVSLKLSSKRYIKKISSTTPVKEILEITDDKFILYYPIEIYEFPLENIYKVVVFNENIHIFKAYNIIYTIVPFDAFKDDNEKDLFMKMLKKEAIYETKL